MLGIRARTVNRNTFLVCLRHAKTAERVVSLTCFRTSANVHPVSSDLDLFFSSLSLPVAFKRFASRGKPLPPPLTPSRFVHMQMFVFGQELNSNDINIIYSP